jgi:peptide chain release factor 3
MAVKHQRLGKDIRLSKSTTFMAQDRVSVEEGFAGDVIGLFDPGIFRIGDTISEGNAPAFEGIPRFSPEHFAQVRVKDAMKRKQMKAGLDQLSEEGAVQVFRQRGMGDQNPILGAVGALQFEVLEFRLKSEYGVDVIIDRLPYTIARWIVGPNFNPRDFDRGDSSICVEDKDGQPIILFRNEWSLRWAEEHSKGLEFRTTAG